MNDDPEKEEIKESKNANENNVRNTVNLITMNSNFSGAQGNGKRNDVGNNCKSKGNSNKVNPKIPQISPPQTSQKSIQNVQRPSKISQSNKVSPPQKEKASASKQENQSSPKNANAHKLSNNPMPYKESTSVAIRTIRTLEYKPETKQNRSVEFLLNKFIQRKNSMNPGPNVLGSLLNTKNHVTTATNDTSLFSQVGEEPCFNFFDKMMSPNEEHVILSVLVNNFIFQDFLKDSTDLILSEFMCVKVPKDKNIYEPGDDGNLFYIVAEGELEKSQNKNKVSVLRTGDSFGELSLLTLKKREETIKCLTNCAVYVIDAEKFREFQQKKNEQIQKERFEFLNTIAMFESLDKISKYNVAQKLNLKVFKEGETIIHKGDQGDNLYIIKEGAVSCRIGSAEIRKLSQKETFGENAIIVDTKRGCDIVAMQKTACYELTREDLKEALGDDYVDVILYCFFIHCIENHSYLKSIFTEDNLLDIFKCLNIVQYSKNEKLFNIQSQNSFKALNKKLVIVISGSLFKEEMIIADRGKILGDNLFIDFNKGIDENIFIDPDCITLEGKITEIAKIAKIDLNKSKTINIGSSINKLKKLYLFKNLSENTLEKIAMNMKKQKFKAGEIIVQEGTKGDKLFLITKGKIKISKDGKYIRELESGSCLGENSLLTDNTLRTATATAIDKVVCYVISKSDFDLILTDKETRNYLQKKLALQDTSIALEDLYYIKFLGKGKFGSVSLVHNGKNIYAIKAISRRSVEREKILARYFVNERRIMLSLDHPFIIKMVKSMKNTAFCFFLIEYVNGKNLDEYLNTRMTKKNIYETQFYIGSLLLTLDYLQKKFIAHRDIKPSNIMIDVNGYLKLIDFGTAKVVTDYTSTIVGTPHYIAPEILQGKGYSLSCDFWSVGICMYEIFYGLYPFGHYANEVIEIYKEILNKDFCFPSLNEKYHYVNTFIKDLLTKKVNQRICNFHVLKKRPFFAGFEFDKLNDFKLESPYVPNTSDMKKYLKETKSKYEEMFKEDNSAVSVKKRSEHDVPNGYSPNWADEF